LLKERLRAKKNFNLSQMIHCAGMFPTVNTRDLSAVRNEIEGIFSSMFPEADGAFINRAFGWIGQWFSGCYPGYLALDARYHNLEHTLQGTLCLGRLLRGRHFTGAHPVLTPEMFEIGLLAILLHDTGYLKRSDDREGTGAKYTLTHVRRSGEFASIFLLAQGCAPDLVASVQNMIRCTGVNVDLGAIPFASELERTVGYALGTADLLGQMAAPDYVEKLPVLFLEFEEAGKFSPGEAPRAIRFRSAAELMQNTPAFWDNYVWPKIDRDFGALHRFLCDPFPDGPNFYLDAVESNLVRLRQRNAA
jgi:hypothetical protein